MKRRSFKKHETLDRIRQPKREGDTLKRLARKSGISISELRVIQVQFPTLWKHIKRAA